MTHLITAGALIAATLVPAALSAQMARTSPAPSYHLMQVSVNAEDISPEEFKAKTATIRSCDDAVTLVETLGAEWKRNRFVRANELPQDLRQVLRDLPAGHATPVFGDEAAIMRVLVLCART